MTTISEVLNEEAPEPALAGNIMPTLGFLYVDQAEAHLIWSRIQDICDLHDIALILAAGWGLMPAMAILYGLLVPTNTKFQDSRLYHVTRFLAHACRLALLVYAIDLLDVVRLAMNIHIDENINIPKACAKVIYIVFLAYKFGVFKQYLIMKYIGNSTNGKKSKRSIGFASLVNHLADAVLGAITAFVLIDVLEISGGTGLKSAITFGSAGTLAFTLASQSVVGALINGLVLSTTGRFYEGELVKFGDGTSAKVERMGWLETVLRGSDDVMISVPNTQLSGQRVSNLSRNQMCQVLQKLRFHYEDIEKLPALAKSILEEIKASCPQVITDGARQFRCVFSNYCDTHVELMVDVHFWLPCIGDAYWNNRQECLMAIHRAVKKHNVQFALLKYGAFQGVAPLRHNTTSLDGAEDDSGNGPQKQKWPWDPQS